MAASDVYDRAYELLRQPTPKPSSQQRRLHAALHHPAAQGEGARPYTADSQGSQTGFRHGIRSYSSPSGVSVTVHSAQHRPASPMSSERLRSAGSLPSPAARGPASARPITSGRASATNPKRLLAELPTSPYSQQMMQEHGSLMTSVDWEAHGRDWLRDFDRELGAYSSVAVFADVKIQEMRSIPVSPGCPNVFRTAIALTILDRLIGQMQHGDLLAALRDELCRAIYSDWDPPGQSGFSPGYIDRTPFFARSMAVTEERDKLKARLDAEMAITKKHRDRVLRIINNWARAELRKAWSAWVAFVETRREQRKQQLVKSRVLTRIFDNVLQDCFVRWREYAVQSAHRRRVQEDLDESMLTVEERKRKYNDAAKSRASILESRVIQLQEMLREAQSEAARRQQEAAKALNSVSSDLLRAQLEASRISRAWAGVVEREGMLQIAQMNQTLVTLKQAGAFVPDVRRLLAPASVPVARLLPWLNAHLQRSRFALVQSLRSLAPDAMGDYAVLAIVVEELSPTDLKSGAVLEETSMERRLQAVNRALRRLGSLPLAPLHRRPSNEDPANDLSAVLSELYRPLQCLTGDEAARSEALHEEAAELEALKAAPVPELLIAWVNYLLALQSSSRRISNLGDDLLDCESYLAIAEHCIPEKGAALAKSVRERDLRSRKVDALSKGLESLGVPPGLVVPDELARGRPLSGQLLLTALFGLSSGLPSVAQTARPVLTKLLEDVDALDKRWTNLFHRNTVAAPAAMPAAGAQLSRAGPGQTHQREKPGVATAGSGSSAAPPGGMVDVDEVAAAYNASLKMRQRVQELADQLTAVREAHAAIVAAMQREARSILEERIHTTAMEAKHAEQLAAAAATLKSGASIRRILRPQTVAEDEDEDEEDAAGGQSPGDSTHGGKGGAR